jgi:hypothetical protein
MKDLGPLHHFLIVSVDQQPDNLFTSDPPTTSFIRYHYNS